MDSHFADYVPRLGLKLLVPRWRCRSRSSRARTRSGVLSGATRARRSLAFRWVSRPHQFILILEHTWQIAGSKLPQLVRTAEILTNEFGPKNGRERAQIDFVDVNCGCPIDLVFRTGAGSARKCIRPSEYYAYLPLSTGSPRQPQQTRKNIDRHVACSGRGTLDDQSPDRDQRWAQYVAQVDAETCALGRQRIHRTSPPVFPSSRTSE